MNLASHIRGAVLPILLLLAALGLVPNCTPKQAIVNEAPSSPEEMLDQGRAYLNEKKFSQAIALFQKLTYEYATSRYGADAQFYLAETYFARRDYLSAASEYEFLTANFPGSRFLEEANYKTALCYLKSAPASSKDPTNLQKAKELIDLFRERYPSSVFLAGADSIDAEIANRYARKHYDAGRMYLKALEYRSAEVYFRYIIDHYPNTAIMPEVMYDLAVCYENTQRKELAAETYFLVTTTAQDEKLRKRAQNRLAAMKQ